MGKNDEQKAAEITGKSTIKAAKINFAGMLLVAVISAIVTLFLASVYNNNQLQNALEEEEKEIEPDNKINNLPESNQEPPEGNGNLKDENAELKRKNSSLEDKNTKLKWENSNLKEKNKSLSAIIEKTSLWDKATVNPSNGHRYMEFKMKTDWDSAKELCERLGGHLVAFTDDKEMEFLHDKLNINENRLYWIGAFYNKDYKRWEWVTSEKIRMNSWAWANPMLSQSYAVIDFKKLKWYSKWDDLYYFICEWD